MSSSRDINLPTLTIVAGRPGAGKSTLAHILAKRIHCPLISRDAIKEGMVNTIGDKGAPGGLLAQNALTTFFEVIELLLGRGVTVVADAFFPEELWKSQIAKLSLLAKINLVVCDVEDDIALERLERRRNADPYWDEFHNQPVNQKLMPATRYEPPELGVPTLIVSCRSEYNPEIESIYRFTKS